MKWLWKILAAIALWLSGLFNRKSNEEDAEDVSDEIDESDDDIIDDTDPDSGDEDDFFNNDDWNPTPKHPSPIGSVPRY